MLTIDVSPNRSTNSSIRHGRTLAPRFALATMTTQQVLNSSQKQRTQKRSSSKFQSEQKRSIKDKQVPIFLTVCSQFVLIFAFLRHVDCLARTRRKRLCSQLSGPRGLFRGLGFHPRSPQTPQESGFVRAFPSHLEPYKYQLLADEPGSSPPYPEYPPASGVHIGQLPAPTLANIRDIERSLKTVVRSAPIRERIAENIVSTVRVPPCIPPFVLLRYRTLTTLPPNRTLSGNSSSSCMMPRTSSRSPTCMPCAA
jgi:hypothetical protein